MRYRIGRLDISAYWDKPTVFIDNIEDMATVKSILRRLKKDGPDPKIGFNDPTCVRYFVDVLFNGYWHNVSDYWCYRAREVMEELYDAGKIDDAKMDRFIEDAPYLLYPDECFDSYEDYQNA